jgi:hypothetical protein
MLGVFLWDCLLFKDYIIPIHSNLPQLIRVLSSTAFFVMLFFEMVLFFIITLSSVLQDREDDGSEEGAGCIIKPKILIGRVALIVALCMLIDLHSTFWTLMLALYLAPQILKNYNDLMIFDKTFVFIGYNISFLLFLYFRGVPNTVGKLEKNFAFCFIFVAVITIQFIVLFLQSRFIPKLFSASSVQPLMDYFRFAEDLENHHPAKKDEPCSICLQQLCDNPMSQNKANKKINLLIKKVNHSKLDVVITPCDHSFHTTCLIEWIETKPECPMCRKKLDFLI